MHSRDQLHQGPRGSSSFFFSGPQGAGEMDEESVIVAHSSELLAVMVPVGGVRYDEVVEHTGWVLAYCSDYVVVML